MNESNTESITPHGEHQPIVVGPEDRAAVNARVLVTDHDPIVVSPTMQSLAHGNSQSFQLTLPVAATPGTTVTAFVVQATNDLAGRVSYAFTNQSQSPNVGSSSLSFSILFGTAGTCYVTFIAVYGNTDSTIPSGSLITVT